MDRGERESLTPLTPSGTPAFAAPAPNNIEAVTTTAPSVIFMCDPPAVPVDLATDRRLTAVLTQDSIPKLGRTGAEITGLVPVPPRRASLPEIPGRYFSGIDEGGDTVAGEHLAIAFKASAKFGAALRILRTKTCVIRGARVPDPLRICVGRCARTQHRYAGEDCEAESIGKLNHGILSSDWNFELRSWLLRLAWRCNGVNRKCPGGAFCLLRISYHEACSGCHGRGNLYFWSLLLQCFLPP